MSLKNPKILIVGAGIGGLVTAAIMSKIGLDITVLEAHTYPGGCAGSFYHQGYIFEAGATLSAGFFPGGPMDMVREKSGISSWPNSRTSDCAMIVHLPDDSTIPLYGSDKRWDIRHKYFGNEALLFWEWQEKTAAAMWEFALLIPEWPPQSIFELLHLANKGIYWSTQHKRHSILPSLIHDAFRPVSSHLINSNDRLKLLIDSQLLISAQADSLSANALYGASALDLPRRGLVQFEGGIGVIANTLANAIRNNGGKIIYREKVTDVMVTKNKPFIITTKNKNQYDADILILNIPPWNIIDLNPEFKSIRRLNRLTDRPYDGWGAFIIYTGFDSSIINEIPGEEFPLHHQIIKNRPLGEGNTIFLSISPSWDNNRAPKGRRAATISTHTNLSLWWDLIKNDFQAYTEKKNEYTNKILSLAEKVLPSLRDASDLILPGTPITFERFTHRKYGWVGGHPQTNLLRGWPPKLAANIWMVGDNIFPGQSIASVSLGGIRVAKELLSTL